MENQTEESNAKTGLQIGAPTAIARSVFGQIVHMYFRTPVKLFRPPRFDYAATARELKQTNGIVSGRQWTWRHLTPVLLYDAVRDRGVSFVPKHVIPSMVMNSAIGVVLYTTYVSLVSQSDLDPPPIQTTWPAGFIAGVASSIVAAPLEAANKQSQMRESLKFTSQAHYYVDILRKIGWKTVIAGLSLASLKDGLSFAAFFSTWELIKGQAYIAVIPQHIRNEWRIARPLSLLIAGTSATVSYYSLAFPMKKIQLMHEKTLYGLELTRKDKFKPEIYLHAYKKTLQQLRKVSNRLGLFNYLYKGFLWSCIRQMPATAAALIIFEEFRERLQHENVYNSIDSTKVVF